MTAGEVFQTMPLPLRAAAQQLAEDAFGRCGIGEVGQEAGMVPVRHGGHDQPLEIGQDGLHGLALFGAVGGQRVGQLARLDRRQHGVPLGVGQKVGDPVDGLVAMSAELFRCHISGRYGAGGRQFRRRFGRNLPVSIKTALRHHLRSDPLKRT